MEYMVVGKLRQQLKKLAKEMGATIEYTPVDSYGCATMNIDAPDNMIWVEGDCQALVCHTYPNCPYETLLSLEDVIRRMSFGLRPMTQDEIENY